MFVAGCAPPKVNPDDAGAATPPPPPLRPPNEKAGGADEEGADEAVLLPKPVNVKPPADMM